MHYIKRAFLLMISSSLMVGCGGIADTISQDQLSLHVTGGAHNVSGRKVNVAMQKYADAPFVEKQDVALDQSGNATVVFRTMGSSAFFVVPPIGSSYQRVPKPTYRVVIGRKMLYVSPTTPGTTYIWRNHSWYTDASVYVE